MNQPTASDASSHQDMISNVSPTTAWIGTLGDPADQRRQVATALAELHDYSETHFVPISTESVDDHVRRRTQTCRLDAAVLLVSASEGPTDKTAHLLSLLGTHDVPVVIAFVSNDSTEMREEIRDATQELARAHLGYAPPSAVLPTHEHDASHLKQLAQQSIEFAAKRQRRRNSSAPSAKDYPFVITQLDLDGLMQRNVRHALDQHRERGESIAVWRDGRVITLTADEISGP